MQPSPVTKHQLSNGLLVLLKEIHTAPLISHWTWYRVGSRNEAPGITGISHWVEHMQFKGTPTFPAGVLDKAIARLGGYWNAMTSLDWTTYYETLPANEIDLALRLEADRMTNTQFTLEDVDSERTVIISERQGNENSPVFRLAEEVQAAAFRIHPYHHEVIGDMPDLETIGRDDLYNHYRAHYAPNNAVLAVAGDFDTEDMLARVRELYEPISTADLPAWRARSEPPQNGERSLVVEGPGETTFLQASYHAPPASHPDFIPLMLAGSLLTGASSLNMFGDGISNKTSRLYQALVEKELSVAVYGNLHATIDPYLFTVALITHPDRTVAENQAALDAEIERLQATPPSPDELARARKQARALFAYGSESITNQAYWMGFTEMYAAYDWYTTYLDRLDAACPEDIQRVAQHYLRPQQRTLGEYRPVNSEQ